MVRSYSFAIIRFAPDQARGEQLNIGLIVFTETGADVRLSHRLDRLKVMSAALNLNTVARVAQSLAVLDASSINEGKRAVADRVKILAKLGPITLSDIGTLVTNKDGSYEDRIHDLMQFYIEPEPVFTRVAKKKTRLISDVKAAFKNLKVLASNKDDINSHRIIAGYRVDDGLVADLVLKNGSYHVVETVDVLGDENVLRRAISNIAISALVLESARMKFGEDTKSRLVYQASAALEKFARPSLDAAQHQGAELINWASVDDRLKFINTLSSLAVPMEGQKNKRFIVSKQDGFIH